VDVELIMPGSTQPAAAPTPAPTAVAATQSASAAPAASPATPPATATVATTPAPPIPVAAETAGVYLQLAAFGSKENADAYVSRVRADVSWLDGQLQVQPREGLFRVRAGPYGSRDEARQAADRINQTLRVVPVVQSK
jgi:rare lipoprotein A